jgi:replicative DNA helicase
MLDDFQMADDAERAVLGALIADNSLVGDVESLLRSDDFFFERNRVLYSAILYKYACGEALDIITLSAYLREGGKLDSVGGISKLSELIDAAPDVSNATQYADTVKRMALSRGLRGLSKQIENDLNSNSPQTVIDNSLSSLIKLSEQATDSNQINIGDLATAEVDYLISILGGARPEDTTKVGYKLTDKILGGLKTGEMVIIAARPSVGKTAFAVNIALNIAKENKPVMFFSLEMGRKPLIRRSLSIETTIPYRAIEEGSMSDVRVEKMRIARDKLRTIPLIIDDSSQQTLATIRTKARRQMAKGGLSVIIVDYLQLCCKNPEDREEIAMWSKGLRSIAKDLGVTIIPIAQLSRYVEHRDDNRPVLADLKGSGQMEQDADVIAFLFNKDPRNKLWTTLYVAKQRNGPCGDIEFDFENLTTAFKERPVEDDSI